MEAAVANGIVAYTTQTDTPGHVIIIIKHTSRDGDINKIKKDVIL